MCLCLFVRGMESSECACLCVHMQYVSSCVCVCVNGKERERAETEPESTRHTAIDIPLTSAPGTMRLSADEIQINCKAVR